MISTVFFLNILKISRVTPVFKKGDSSAANNYCPISNLVVLNKIFEKLIYKRLIHFLENHNILINKQYGFRRGLGTEDALQFFPIYTNLLTIMSILVPYS